MSKKIKYYGLNYWDRLMKKTGKDYWKLSDLDLTILAINNNIVNSVFISNKLTKNERKLIIDELTKRDKFISSFIAIAISVIALAVSVLVAIFK